MAPFLSTLLKKEEPPLLLSHVLAPPLNEAQFSPLDRPKNRAVLLLTRPVLLLEESRVLVIRQAETRSHLDFSSASILLLLQVPFLSDFKILVSEGLGSWLLFILFDCPSNQIFHNLILEVVAFPKPRTRQ